MCTPNRITTSRGCPQTHIRRARATNTIDKKLTQLTGHTHRPQPVVGHGVRVRKLSRNLEPHGTQSTQPRNLEPRGTREVSPKSAELEPMGEPAAPLRGHGTLQGPEQQTARSISRQAGSRVFLRSCSIGCRARHGEGGLSRQPGTLHARGAGDPDHGLRHLRVAAAPAPVAAE